jgi:hypothetical protein
VPTADTMIQVDNVQVDVDVKVSVKVDVTTNTKIQGNSGTWEITNTDGCQNTGFVVGPGSSLAWRNLWYKYQYQYYGKDGITLHIFSDCEKNTGYWHEMVLDGQSYTLCKVIDNDPTGYDCGYLWSVEQGLDHKVFITQKYLGLKYTKKGTKVP